MATKRLLLYALLLAYTAITIEAFKCKKQDPSININDEECTKKQRYDIDLSNCNKSRPKNGKCTFYSNVLHQPLIYTISIKFGIISNHSTNLFFNYKIKKETKNQTMNLKLLSSQIIQMNK